MTNRIWRMGCYFWIQIFMVLYCVAIGYLVALPTIEAKLCTKRVKITHPNVKKIPMTKKIPAKCSNWDRAWTWLTKMDCSTKYVIEYVDFTTHVKEHYKLEYGCCPGDEDCNEAEAHKQDIEESDERFLAITFGSATAALTILIIIIIISVCRKQHNRFGICKSRSEYETAQDHDPSDLCQPGSACQNDYVGDDFKVSECEYEEIRDVPADGWSNISQSKPCSEDIMGFEKSNSFDVIGDFHSSDIPVDAHAHKAPEPSAPFLDSLSETYVEGTLVRNMCQDAKEDSINAQCTDDIDYIAISKTDFSPNANERCSSDGGIELNDIDNSPQDNEPASFSFHYPSEQNLGASSSCFEHEKESEATLKSDFSQKRNSYEQLDPNLAQSMDKPYEALQKCDVIQTEELSSADRFNECD